MLNSAQIDALSDAYEHAWRAGAPPDLLAALREGRWTPEGADQRLAAELGAIDLEQRWRRRAPLPGANELPDADDYALLLYGVGAGPSPTWVVSERSARVAAGEGDPLDVLRARYADCPAVLEALRGHKITRLKEGALGLETGVHRRSAMTTEAHSATPGSFGSGRYLVKGLLGQGGQKRVYLAGDAELEREVVIAVLSRGAMTQGEFDLVREEARAMARLDEHPHIAGVYDIGEQDGDPYIVAQYIGGGSVADVLANLRPRAMAVGRALRIAAQTCRALAHAHGRGILHRDVKPANVLLTKEDAVKLGDFGLAVTLEAAQRAGVVAGTAAYMSPEQAEGRPVGPSADLYSLGVMLFEMVTGRLPFNATDWYAMLAQHVNARPIAPSRINPAVAADLDRLVLRLLTKPADERPNDAAEVAESLELLTQSAGPSLVARRTMRPLEGLGSGFLVGRGSELEGLRRGLEAAVGGSGCINVVVGEPGSGKTRLVEELATYAQIRGVTVAAARCPDFEGATAFFPWVQALRSLADLIPNASVSDEVRRTIDKIGVVGEELERSAAEASSPGALAPDTTRFRLFDHVSQFLRSLALEAPLLIVMDDLQWADSSTLKMLEFICQDLRDSAVMLVATKRNTTLGESGEVDRVMAELTRSPIFSRTTLAGFRQEEIGDYVESVASFRPPERFLKRIWDRTHGNPFFVGEVCKLLASDGMLVPETDFAAVEIGLPDGVRDVVRRRLNPLSPACLDVLRLCSILGREVSILTLQGLCGQTEGLFETLDEAIQAGVLSEGRGDSELAFTHDLIRETVYHELSPLLRKRMHRDVASGLEAIQDDPRAASPAEIARHLIAAGPLGDARKAANYSIEAGASSLRQLAYEEAVRQFEQAVDLMNGIDSIEGERRAEVLISLGEAQRRAGELQEASDSFLAAYDATGPSGVRHGIAELATGVVEANWALRAPKARDIDLCDEALASIGPNEIAKRVRLLSGKATTLRYLGQGEAAATAANEAVEIARRAADSSALSYALNGLMNLISGPDFATVRLRHANEMLASARQAGNSEQVFHAAAWRIFSLLELGDGVAFDKALAVARRVAADLRQPFYSHLIEAFSATEAILAGELGRAETHAMSAFKLARRVGLDGGGGAFGTQMFTIRREQGRTSELAPLVKMFLREHPDSGWRPGLALIYADLGEVELARAILRDSVVDGLESIPKDGVWSTAVAFLAEVAIAVGDEEDSQAVFDLLEPYRDYTLASAGSAVCLGSTARYLGGLSARLGDWDAAEEAFEVALDHNASLRARVWLNHTRYLYAKMLMQRGASGDRARGAVLLDLVDKDVSGHELGLLSRRVAALRNP